MRAKTLGKLAKHMKCYLHGQTGRGGRKGEGERRADRQSDGTDKQTTLKANPTVNKACGMRHKASHMYESVLEERTYAMWTAIKCAICAINEPNKSRNRKRKKEKRKKRKPK